MSWPYRRKVIPHYLADFHSLVDDPRRFHLPFNCAHIHASQQKHDSNADLLAVELPQNHEFTIEWFLVYRWQYPNWRTHVKESVTRTIEGSKEEKERSEAKYAEMEQYLDR